MIEFDNVKVELSLRTMKFTDIMGVHAHKMLGMCMMLMDPGSLVTAWWGGDDDE